MEATATLPLSSHQSIGSDPMPYLDLMTGERSERDSFRRATAHRPRPQFTHTPAAPSALLIAFRDEWESPEVNGAFDLGEYAEQRLSSIPDDGTRETRMVRRVLSLCATVLPRHYAEFEAKRDAMV
jgi:hypothetical protein